MYKGVGSPKYLKNGKSKVIEIFNSGISWRAHIIIIKVQNFRDPSIREGNAQKILIIIS